MKKISISDTLEHALDVVEKNYQHILLFGFVFFLVSMTSLAFSGLDGFIENTNIKNIFLILYLVFSLATLPLMYSVQHYAHEIDRGVPSSFGLLFDIYKKFIKIFLFKLVLFLIILLVLLPLFISIIQIIMMNLEVFESFGSLSPESAPEDLKEMLKGVVLTDFFKYSILFSGILLLLLSIFTTFADYVYLFEENAEIIDAIAKSYQMVMSNKFETLALIVVGFICGIITLLTCFLGSIFIVPFRNLFHYYLYRKIAENYDTMLK
ncbi:MAG: hypothetical protein MUE53_04285 [Chitinophagales bacterium]|jgi:hypothetical protein|nr:hypothetical protein [Chitinophagales bacterium]